MPTIVFGEGSGQTGGDHKTSTLAEFFPTRSYASDTQAFIRNNAGISDFAVLRFSLTGHIPTNATVNSAILTTTLDENSGGQQTVSLHDMLTAWGVTPTSEGVNEAPATGGQATWDNAFDFNSGSDVGWADGVGAGISSNDYIAAETTFLITPGHLLGQVYNSTITTMVANWVADDATNYGVILIPNIVLVFNKLASQNNGTAARRPFLTVDYSVPVSLTSITPNSGPTVGGTPVSIVGTGFGAAQGTGSVTIDGNAVSIVSWADLLITGTTPAGTAGAKDVVVTNDDSQSDTLTGGYTYTAGGGIFQKNKANLRRKLYGESC